MPAASLAYSGSQIKVNLYQNSTKPYRVSWMYIAQSDVDDRDIVDGTKTTITFGGNAYQLVSAGAGTVGSDWITFSLDETKGYSITYYITPSSAPDYVYADKYGAGASGSKRYLFNTTEQTANDWSALSPGGDTNVSHVDTVQKR